MSVEDQNFGNTPWLKRLGVVGAVLTVATAILGMANQAEVAEPHWVATRYFVRAEVAQATQQLERRQISTQLFLAKSERSRLENEIANKQVLLSQNPTMPQPVRAAIEEQVRSLNVELEAAKRAFDKLQSEQK